jgi:DNA-directed RNA polymerase specialized sigma24 family protein
VQESNASNHVMLQRRGSAVVNGYPGTMSLTNLVELCTNEMNKYRRKEASDDQYCLEIFRRAVILGDNQAWAVLQRQFCEHVRIWLSRHPQREAALRHDEEQSYIDDTFRRFWQAVSEQRLQFQTLASALSYLHLCLNCAVMDVLRAYSRPKEEPLPDYGQSNSEEPAVEDSYQETEVWETIEALLAGEQEKRMAFLHFHCNLKPREIMQYCPGEFSGEDEIYRLKRNIMERLLRSADKIRWRLSSGEK